MLILELSTNAVLLDLDDDGINIFDFEGESTDRGASSYRRGDARLVSNNSVTDKAQLRFEFQRLTKAQFDALESLYRDQGVFICVPNSEVEPEKVYAVRWASGFEWSDTLRTNWSQGKSVAVVFDQI